MSQEGSPFLVVDDGGGVAYIYQSRWRCPYRLQVEGDEEGDPLTEIQQPLGSRQALEVIIPSCHPDRFILLKEPLIIACSKKTQVHGQEFISTNRH